MLVSTVRRYAIAISVGIALQVVIASLPVRAEPVTDYLGIPGPIEVSGQQFHLAWSSKPLADCIKHEYVPAGQQVESYTDRELYRHGHGRGVVVGASVEDAVRTQVAMLNQRKTTDPLVNYRVVRNRSNGQMILDFIMGDDKRKPSIVEWNAYRYVPITTRGGKRAVLLFGISRRHYGDEGSGDFLRALKVKRPADINALAEHAVPEPTERE